MVVDPALARFHPLVATWFSARFGAPTEPQQRGWPAITAGQSTLIAAPTGSGKTLAAFLACLSDLVAQSAAGELSEHTQVVYVSPLKALSNDIHRNLEAPLAEICALATERGEPVPAIRIATRTGDTPAAERARMAKHPPHILVTTPESLYLLVTSESGRRGLAGVRTVIVDEIHAICADKRGAHLSLTLERLERLNAEAEKPAPIRIGLSATQRPIETVARLLAGSRRPLPAIIDTGWARDLDLAIELTDDPLGAVASGEQLGRIYDRIAELCREHATTIVFVNTRRMVERVAHHLEQRLGEDQVVAHHGSLSRALRLAAEEKLKTGQVRCAVATASLELGIDVGTIDLVVQLGSSRAIATLLQRVGRSGHSLAATPKGRLFALTRDQLVEQVALVRAIGRGILDTVALREAPLDILAQQIVAEVACGEIGEDDLYELCTRAACYGDLSRADFDAIITMLAEGTATRGGRRGARLHRDRIASRLRARRGSRLAALTGGGAIPDQATYPVIEIPAETPVGTLDEDFAIESMAGDVFLLGNTSWQIDRIEAGRVLVTDAAGAPPTIPFWFGEAPARTAELSAEVADLRADVEARLLAGHSHADIAAHIMTEVKLPASAAEELIDYLAASRAALGALPTHDHIIAERFFDDVGGMHLILHAPFGGRINRAWGLALRKRFCRSFNFELQAAATDDGIAIALGPPHSFPLADVFAFLSADTVTDLLIQAILDVPMFGTRWRWNATRSLAVLRRSGGKRVPPHILRMRTDDLLTAVFPMQQACLETVVGDREVPDHPLVNETIRDCLTEAMDADGLREMLARIASGDITVSARDTVEPSPLCHEILNANPYAFLDDAPLEERRTRAISFPRALRPDADHIIDAGAIADAAASAAPTVRDPDELHDLLLTVMLLPEPPGGRWQHEFAALCANGRAARASWGNASAWVAAERVPAIATAVPEARFVPDPRPLPFAVEVPSAEAVIEATVRGHMVASGPRTAAELARFLALPETAIQAALAALEGAGELLRGHFSNPTGDTEYCERHMLARIHKLTLTGLRKRIEPVSAAVLMRFLFRWQRVMPGYQLSGESGLSRIIEQLQGFESAAGAWERELFRARLRGYEPAWLDALCMAGEVTWARLNPRPRDPEAQAPGAPKKSAPLAILLRRDLPVLRASGRATEPVPALTDGAAEVAAVLERRGASFLADIARETHLAPGAVEDALWELCATARATADGFSCLRVLIDRGPGQIRSHFDGTVGDLATSTSWQRALRHARLRDRRRPQSALRALPAAAGRWSLLPAPDADAADAEHAARQLLARYGVVFRALLTRESAIPPWRELAAAMRRLEARGEIRGGRFVSGFSGEQFALPEAVDLLRTLRTFPENGAPEIVRIAATDPLNLAGITSPGAKVPAILGNAVLYKNGVAVASMEAGTPTLRTELDEGERIGDDLTFYPALRSSRFQQIDLPL